jgi:hypothetical protein
MAAFGRFGWLRSLAISVVTVQVDNQRLTDNPRIEYRASASCYHDARAARNHGLFRERSAERTSDVSRIDGTRRVLSGLSR